jgi:hypothetical protein
VQLPGLPSLAELAGLIRQRLVAVDARWRRGETSVTSARNKPADLVVVAAAAPFAATSFARARLLRQLHACGLLTERESEQAKQLLGVAGSG